MMPQAVRVFCANIISSHTRNTIRILPRLRRRAMHMSWLYSPLARLARCGLALMMIAVFLAAIAAPRIQAAAVAPTNASAQQAQLSSDPSLVGYWPFEFGSADADLSGSDNTVTFANGM